MIRGTFVDGRPYVEARIVIPYVNDSGRRVLASSDLRLLVDTGSDRTLLSLFYVEVRLGLPARTLPWTTLRLNGIGGRARVRACDGTLLLLDARRGWLPFRTQFVVYDALSAHLPLDLNLLGADIWGQGDVHVNRPAALVSIEFPEPNSV